MLGCHFKFRSHWWKLTYYRAVGPALNLKFVFLKLDERACWLGDVPLLMKLDVVHVWSV